MRRSAVLSLRSQGHREERVPRRVPCVCHLHQPEAPVRPCHQPFASTPGIHASDQEVIFDKFRQGSGTTDVLTDKPQGTGLGLYLARELCTYNQAKLSHHRGDAGGATFRITFVAPTPLPA